MRGLPGFTTAVLFSLLVAVLDSIACAGVAVLVDEDDEFLVCMV